MKLNDSLLIFGIVMILIGMSMADDVRVIDISAEELSNPAISNAIGIKLVHYWGDSNGSKGHAWPTYSVTNHYKLYTNAITGKVEKDVYKVEQREATLEEKARACNVGWQYYTNKLGQRRATYTIKAGQQNDPIDEAKVEKIKTDTKLSADAISFKDKAVKIDDVGADRK